MKNEFQIIAVSAHNGEISCSVAVDGLFMYRDNSSLFDSVSNFVTDFVNEKHDFNECFGAYRFRMTQKETGDVILFSDNSGMIRFYFNRRDNRFFCSLAEAMPQEERKPNLSAIAQMLCFGCVYDQETIVKSVFLSDPNCFYVLKGQHVEINTKGLKPLSEYSTQKMSLEALIQKAVSHCDGRIGCTITGGTDSRAVLANLIHSGVKPDLAITGHDSEPDVEIAKEISKVMNLNLSIISDDLEESDWLSHSINAADGREGICAVYRLNKLARYLYDKGIHLQFGGVNGEMYKNSFINQDFPIYFGRPNWEKFYKFKVGTFDFDKSMFAETIQTEMKRLPSTIMEWLKTHTGKNKAEAYLNAGYEIMQARCNHIINMFEKYTTIYNPLMERRMAAYAFGMNPYSLEMQSFQRKEVSMACEEIKNIKTDRGLTCNFNRRTIEFLKCYYFLVKVALQRILFRKKIDIRIDKCFEEGLKNNLFRSAVDNVKRMKILNENTDIHEIPAGLADRLFTVGLFFQTKSADDLQ